MSKVKVFSFASVTWRPDSDVYLDVVIAAGSLASAKHLLQEADFRRPDKFFTAVSPVARELALANVGAPIWLDLDDLDGGWHVGGKAEIAAYHQR